MFALFVTVSSLYILILVWMCFAGIGEANQAPSAESHPLSVIIAARNEADRLQRNLPEVLTQSYPATFEVLLVLDRCTDGSAEIALQLQASHPHIRIIEIKETPPGWAPKNGP